MDERSEQRVIRVAAIQFPINLSNHLSYRIGVECLPIVRWKNHEDHLGRSAALKGWQNVSDTLQFLSTVAHVKIESLSSLFRIVTVSHILYFHYETFVVVHHYIAHSLYEGRPDRLTLMS